MDTHLSKFAERALMSAPVFSQIFWHVFRLCTSETFKEQNQLFYIHSLLRFNATSVFLKFLLL